MTRVLLLHPTRTFGGAERTALNLIEGLDPERFSVELVTGAEIADRFPAGRLTRVTEFEKLGINEWYTRNTFRDMIRDSMRLRGFLKERKPDIALGMMYYASALLAIAGTLGNIQTKVIASPRGPMGAFLEEFYPSTGTVRITWKLSFHVFCRFSDAVVVASEGLRRECVDAFGAHEASTFVVNNGIDSATVRELAKEGTGAAGLEIKDGEFVAVTMGRLAAEKDLPLLLGATARLRGKVPVRLIVVGDGPERRSLTERARRLGIEDAVTFTGYDENPFKYLANAHIFVHTCRLEGFGNSMVEAMAAGLPVVATDCPFGPREIVEDGKSGILIEMGNEAALARAIEKLAHDDGMRNALSKGARKRADYFTVKRMVQGYEKIFEGLAGG